MLIVAADAAHALVGYVGCAYEVRPGPGRLLRWSVPASRGRDDLLVSAALVARLDAVDGRPRTAPGGGRGRVGETRPTS